MIFISVVILPLIFNLVINWFATKIDGSKSDSFL